MTTRQAYGEIQAYKSFPRTSETDLIINALDIALRLKRENELEFQNEDSYKNFLKSITHNENGTLVLNDDLCEEKIFIETVDGVEHSHTMKMLKEVV